MSTCISSHGEYSDHTFPDSPDAERFVCTRCFVFDEDAAMEALDRAEAKLAASEAIAEAAREWQKADSARLDALHNPLKYTASEITEATLAAIRARRALVAAVDAQCEARP